MTNDNNPNLTPLHTTILGSITFYTALPIPVSWPQSFHGIARFAPLVGLLLGGLLGLEDLGLTALGMPVLTHSAIVVVSWVVLTGGLHLDGAMDTADGLAATNPARRLEVMADSVTGAFGVMAAVSLLLLKVAALNDLATTFHASPFQPALLLMAVAGWGRWGQLLAIWRYPYLKPEGKGAFHKAAIQSGWDVLPSLLLLLGLAAVQAVLIPNTWRLAIVLPIAGAAIAAIVGYWLNRQLTGQTGDTYGAIVEWTEALLLVVLTMIS